MEWKIGEIKKVNGEWCQCVEQPEKYDKTVCDLCAFQGNGNCELDRCSGTYRSDKKSVIFKKLEKVGEPFSCNYYGDNRMIMMQEYQLFCVNVIYCDSIPPIYITDYKHNRIAIEIKQNQEDMEEKKHNLKPFDLEKARLGKPVCTRDGRKARIICFDLKNEAYPIVAAIGNDSSESLLCYTINGEIVKGNYKSEKDLMMLPEKKEGWINIYKEGLLDTKVYNTKEEAFNKASLNDYVDTVKICWEE